MPLQALDAATGARQATFSVPGNHTTNTIVVGDRVFVGTGTLDSSAGPGGEGTLRALDGIHAGGTW